MDELLRTYTHCSGHENCNVIGDAGTINFDLVGWQMVVKGGI